jgi:hypothetical protein
MINFTAGLTTMGYLIAGLFFLRFWRRTGDGLFLAFWLAFWLFALTSALIALSGLPREEASWFYLLRLAGFGLIIAAILVKNAGPDRRR